MSRVQVSQRIKDDSIRQRIAFIEVLVQCKQKKISINEFMCNKKYLPFTQAELEKKVISEYSKVGCGVIENLERFSAK